MNRSTKYALSLLIAGGVAASAVAAHAEWRGHMRGGPAMMERLDPDGDGRIVIEDVQADRVAELARFDADGDGQLSLAEYEKLFAERMRRRMVDSFQRLDDDGDGVVTEAEATAPVTRMARRLDENGDGVIEKDELRQAMMHRRGGKHGKHGHHERRGRDHDRDDD